MLANSRRGEFLKRGEGRPLFSLAKTNFSGEKLGHSPLLSGGLDTLPPRAKYHKKKTGKPIGFPVIF